MIYPQESPRPTSSEAERIFFAVQVTDEAADGGNVGRNGVVGSVERGAARTVLLDAAQVVGLLVALHSAHLAPYRHAANSAVTALTEALDPAGRRAVEELCARIRVERPDARAPERVRSVLEDAVRDQRVVNLRYVDRHGADTRRSVDPVAFLGTEDGWALIGWCHMREAGRLFRLDRIVTATATRRASRQHDVDEALGWVPREVRPLR